MPAEPFSGQNSAALYLARLFPGEGWSAAAVRETASRLSENSGALMPYQTVSLNFYTLTVVPVSNSGPFLITYLPGAQQAGTPGLMPGNPGREQAPAPDQR